MVMLKFARLFLSFVVIVPMLVATSSQPAQASCILPQEQGSWVNTDANTASLTRINIIFTCNDVIFCPNGVCQTPPPPFELNIFGKCHPTDCVWEPVRADHSDSHPEWLYTTINKSWVTRHVYVRTYSENQLRVWIWSDYHDSRTDRASDDWFERAS